MRRAAMLPLALLALGLAGAAADTAPLEVVCNSGWTLVTDVSRELVDTAYGIMLDMAADNYTAAAPGYKACPAGDAGLALSSAGCQKPDGSMLKALVNATCPGADGKPFTAGFTFAAAKAQGGSGQLEVVDVDPRFLMEGDTFVKSDFVDPNDPRDAADPTRGIIFEWGSGANLAGDAAQLPDGLPADFMEDHDDDDDGPKLPLNEAASKLIDEMSASSGASGAVKN